MLGTIWDGSESVVIKKDEKYVTIRGECVEVAMEAQNKIRLSVVQKVDNRNEQYREAMSGFRSLLESRRKDLAVNKQELREITIKLNDIGLEENAVEELEIQARDKRAIARVHAEEIMKMEAQTTVNVNYSVVKTGKTAVFPPGLTLKATFLSGPICWCPYNMPVTKLLEETTIMVEELPMTTAEHITAHGDGLECCVPTDESTFIITVKNDEGKPRDISGDTFVVESKEAEIKPSIVDKKNGSYEVSYSAGGVKEVDQFSLAVTLFGCHISGSPFLVSVPRLLLKVSSTDYLAEDWLDTAVAKMSNNQRARLYVRLFDTDESEVYRGSGVTNNKWSKYKITTPGIQFGDDKHTNAIKMDNGDWMLIIGKTTRLEGRRNWQCDVYCKYSVTIIAGGDLSTWSR